MSAVPTRPPVVEVDPLALSKDPYPIYAELRRDAPLAFAPALGMHLVTRYADVSAVAGDPETFSSVGGAAHRVTRSWARR